jgi:hypothetical protein
MSTAQIDPYVCSAPGTMTNMSPPGKTVSFGPTPTPGPHLSWDVITGQGWTADIAATRTSRLTPTPAGVGKTSKFYSGAGTGTGFMTAYGSGNGTFIHLQNGGWGTGTNESPIFPIFNTNNTYNNADLVNIINTMATNFPGLIYGVCICQESDAKIAQAASWASGQLVSGAISTTNLATCFADAWATIGSMGAHATCKLMLCLTSYQQVDVTHTGRDYTDFHTKFVAAGAQIDYILADVYQQYFSTGQGHPTSWTAAFHMGWATAAANLFGCRWGVGELGFTQSQVSGDTDSDAKMAARITGAVTYMTGDALCDFGAYWADRQLYGLYLNSLYSCPLSLAAWTNAMAANP